MWLFGFGYVDNTVFYIFCAVSAVVVLLTAAIILASCCIAGHSGASSIDLLIAIGSVILSYTVLARGIDQDWGDDSEYEAICQFFPAALLIGLTLFIGGQFVKGWGIYLYNKFNSDRSPQSEEWKPNLWIWALLIIAGIVSLIWCVRYTPELKYLDERDEIVRKASLARYYECEYEYERSWMVATSAWHGMLLLLAVAAIAPNCKVSRHQEAHVHSLITMNTLFSVVAGIIFHFLYEGSDETIKYAVNGGLMLWMCLFADILLLGARMCIKFRGRSHNKQDNYDTIKDRNSYLAPSPNEGNENQDFAY